MSKLHFAPIKGRSAEIIQAIMDTTEVGSVPELDFTIHLVVEEIVVNIVNYAYPQDSEGEVTIIVELTPSEFSITFSDSGIPFNPLQKPDPDTALSAAERPIGGLGIYLVKQVMDTVTYNYQDGHNILTLTKIIQ